MSHQWKGSVSKVADPLEGFQGQPIVSLVGPNQRYLGRVVVELYETPNSSDVNQLAFTIDAANGVDSSDLLKRIAAALSLRVAKVTKL